MIWKPVILKLCGWRYVLSNQGRSILFGSSSEMDSKMESIIERASLRCNEIIVGGDFNINYLHPASYSKHRLINCLKSLSLTQLVSMVTRPVSSTC